MKILITGANGMLGHALTDILKKEHELILTDSKTLDITDKEKVLTEILKHNPDIVINSAAYTNVDGCEDNPEIAYDVNAIGPRNLALACRQADCTLVHISTDYVFDGTAREPITEEQKTNPINVYGKSKLEGEKYIQEIFNKYFIVRTAWLYGPNGRNFPKTMIELAKTRSEITVVDDETGCPTYTIDLANAISKIIKTDQFGVYHITNSGNCSWCEFAKYIFEVANKNVKVIPISASIFARKVRRPSYSVLNNTQWIHLGFEPLRHYKDAIKEYIITIEE